jgi:hypothetical protein
MSLKHSIEHVKQIFISKDLIPLFTQYNNAKENLLVQSKEGYKAYISYYCVSKRNSTPKWFAKFNPFTFENILLWITLNEPDYKLLSLKFVDAGHNKLIWECDKGHIFNMTWANFQFGQRCPECFHIYNVGENHPNWNPNITRDERLHKRDYQREEVIKWRNLIFERDNYTCQICNKRNGLGETIYLNAHHLNGWNWYIYGRFDVNNGITLCKDCHNLFHGVYNNRNNTKEQFEEFKEMLKGG